MIFKELKTSFFLSYANKDRSDLSKKVIFGPVGQRTAKLLALKVCALRDSNPGRSESSDSLYKIGKNVASQTLRRPGIEPGPLREQQITT